MTILNATQNIDKQYQSSQKVRRTKYGLSYAERPIDNIRLSKEDH